MNIYLITAACVASSMMILAQSQTGGVTTAQQVGIAAVSGALESAAVQPLIYFKNMAQIQQPASWNPIAWYRGYAIDAPGIIATTAITGAVNGALVPYVHPWLAAGTAGAVSAIVGAPAEKLVLHAQQKHAVNFNMKALYPHGFVPTAIREAGSAIGWLALYPWCKQWYAKKLDDKSATVAGGVTAGATTAVVTQPFDVIKTNMQNDVDKKQFKSMMQTGYAIAKTSGPKALFSGLPQRLSIVTLSISVLGGMNEYLTNLTKTYNKKQ